MSRVVDESKFYFQGCLYPMFMLDNGMLVMPTDEVLATFGFYENCLDQDKRLYHGLPEFLWPVDCVMTDEERESLSSWSVFFTREGVPCFGIELSKLIRACLIWWKAARRGKLHLPTDVLKAQFCVGWLIYFLRETS